MNTDCEESSGLKRRLVGRCQNAVTSLNAVAYLNELNRLLGKEELRAVAA
jgi:hypothetical protein